MYERGLFTVPAAADTLPHTTARRRTMNTGQHFLVTLRPVRFAPPHFTRASLYNPPK